jgi:hypothetical protein
MAYGLWGHRKRSSYYLPLSPATNPQSSCRVVLVETSYQAPQAKERAPRSASTREGPRASDLMSREARSCSRWEADRNIADDDSRGCRARRSRLEARAALAAAAEVALESRASRRAQIKLVRRAASTVPLLLGPKSRSATCVFFEL